MKTDEEQIRELHLAWIAAVNAGDLEALLGMMTRDAVFLSPGRPPADREAFAANFRASGRDLLILCESEPEEIVVVGDLAHARSRDSLRVSPRGGGAASRLTGYRLTLYRHRPEGGWLLARDAHTLGPAAG